MENNLTQNDNVQIEEVDPLMNKFTLLIRPLLLTIFISVILVTNSQGDNGDTLMGQSLSAYTVFDESGGSSSAWGAIVNALIIVGVIALMTFVMAALYYFGCGKCLYYLLYFATFSILSFTSGLVFQSFLQQIKVYWDYISFFIIFWNLGIGGCIAIWYQKGIIEEIPNVFLVFISIIAAFLLSFIPEWTAWVLLVLLAIWDIIAVLTPCGPLKWLLKTADERNEPLPGLIYTVGDGRKKGAPPTRSHFTNVEMGDDSEANQNSAAEVDQIAEEQFEEFEEYEVDEGPLTLREMIENAREDDTATQLGLGDFIFYSILISKAAKIGAVPMIACFITVFFGLIGTLACLIIWQKPLPALPFSMILGVAIFFFVSFQIDPVVMIWEMKGLII